MILGLHDVFYIFKSGLNLFLYFLFTFVFFDFIEIGFLLGDTLILLILRNNILNVFIRFLFWILIIFSGLLNYFLGSWLFILILLGLVPIDLLIKHFIFCLGFGVIFINQLCCRGESPVSLRHHGRIGCRTMFTSLVAMPLILGIVDILRDY